MKNLRYQVVEDLEKAKEIWETLSPHKTIDDEWGFRYVFFKHLDYKIHFIVAFDNDKPIALLPLQKNNLKGLMPPYYPNDGKEFLEFFGGDDTDDNDILGKVDDHDFIFRELVWQIKDCAYLAPLRGSFESFPNTLPYENKFILDISKFKNYDQYIDAYFFQKNRGKFKRDIKNIYKNHKIEVEYNINDLDKMFELNLVSHPDSSFKFDYRKDIFKELMSSYQVEIISVSVDDKKEAISYGIIHKEIYYSMNVGANHTINNLGKLLVLLQMQRAIDLKCKIYDAGKGESGWKEHFKFQKIPQFKILVNSTK